MLKIEPIESSSQDAAEGVEVGVPGRWVAGEALRFSCSSEGGNPLPVITWVVIDPTLFGYSHSYVVMWFYCHRLFAFTFVDTMHLSVAECSIVKSMLSYDLRLNSSFL